MRFGLSLIAWKDLSLNDLGHSAVCKCLCPSCWILGFSYHTCSYSGTSNTGQPVYEARILAIWLSMCNNYQVSQFSCIFHKFLNMRLITKNCILSNRVKNCRFLLLNIALFAYIAYMGIENHKNVIKITIFCDCYAKNCELMWFSCEKLQKITINCDFFAKLWK